MNNQNTSFFGRIDWITIGLWFALCTIGWFNIHAAVFNPEHPNLFSLETNYGKQSIYIFTALIIGFCILIIDQRFFISSAPFIYFVVVLLLVAVLVVGRNVGGNQAWIPIGSFRLQPSEFGKLATCLLLAVYLNSQSSKNPNMNSLLIGASIVLFPVFLVMLQPDTGSALAFFSLIFVFYREGYVSTNFMVLGGLAIVLFVLALLVPNEWILVGIITVISGIAIYINRQKRKHIINIGLLFIGSVIYVLSVDFAYENILQTHQRNRIDIIRIGTSGSIQGNLAIGTILASEYAIGFDALMQFYVKPYSPTELVIKEAIEQQFPSLSFKPYVGRASEKLIGKFAQELPKGITMTAPGFYGPQGRCLRSHNVYPNLISMANSFESDGKIITNLEMETAGIYALANMFGHHALSINAILASRVKEEFSDNPAEVVDQAIRYVLDRI